MHRIICTVFFEEPFWIGVWERSGNGVYSAAKVTFGAEPSDAEVLAFLLDSYRTLVFSKPRADRERRSVVPNPKRAQRAAARAVLSAGAGTKAQQALKEQYAAGKQEQKQVSRAERLAEEERKFLLRQEKRKAKHRGR